MYKFLNKKMTKDYPFSIDTHKMFVNLYKIPHGREIVQIEYYLGQLHKYIEQLKVMSYEMKLNGLSRILIPIQKNTEYIEVLKKIKPNKNKKEEEKKFDGTFLKDIYDNNLLPGIDNKYNYTVHKIFLSQILEKIFKKMVEVRDKTNKVITKEEIRKEYINEVDNLRKKRVR